jgi:hypothetical protein
MNPTLSRSRTALVPGLTREGITWATIAPGLVEIRIDLHNDADRPTEPAELVIETAGLGAFVPFRPMTRIAVGALEPGGRRRVQTVVGRAALPGQPLALRSMAEALRPMLEATPEFIDLFHEAQWAGNLNVYFDRRPDRAVEVHRALDLRVTAGRPVAFMVDLPGDSVGYRVDVRTSDLSWTAQVASLKPSAAQTMGPLINSFHFLIVRPPSVAGVRGSATVEATRLRDNKIVPVEFAFETVEGPGGSLGCIRI